MVNVGLVTSALLPNPATTPLTNNVLPLPKSPLRAKTDPIPIFSATCRPIASVSSGLLEMSVATSQLRISDCGLQSERTNMCQRQFWESTAPLFSQPYALAPRDSDEQIVIVTIRKFFHAFY